MKLPDILPTEKWIELEEEINRRSGLNAAVFDNDGFRITGFKKWANRLCPAVKANEKGQTYICALAHQNIAAIAMQTKKPVIEECDAGMAKLVVPIFIKEEFMGVAGGCGLLPEDGEINTYLIHKTLGIDEEKLESLSDDIETITNHQLQLLSAYITKQIEEITNGKNQDLEMKESFGENCRNPLHSGCIMCGNQNPFGLKLTFSTDYNDGIVGYFTPTHLLEGYSGILHGGVAAALLDSAMTNWLFVHKITALTGELNIKYLKPIPIKKEIIVKANVSKSTSPLHNLEAKLFVDNILMTRATARFMESFANRDNQKN